VQEMINASQQDFLKKSNENAASIDVLKQTAKASLENDSKHAATLRELQKQQAEVSAVLDTMVTNLEAMKVMAASSVVRMSELQEAIDGNKTVMDVYIEKMRANDQLYEKVLTEYFRQLAESANASLEALQSSSQLGAVGLPVKRKPIPMAEPIEIEAPDTSEPTNSAAE
jgi:hypothetical protein